MTLLDDIKADRIELAADLDSIAAELTEAAVSSVEREGTCPTILGALVGLEREYHCLQWRNAWEKAKVLKSVNAELTERGAVGTALVFGGSINNSAGLATPAIILVLRSAFGKSVKLLPWSRAADGHIVWQEPVVKSVFKSNLVTAPELN